MRTQNTVAKEISPFGQSVNWPFSSFRKEKTTTTHNYTVVAHTGARCIDYMAPGGSGEKYKEKKNTYIYCTCIIFKMKKKSSLLYSS